MQLTVPKVPLVMLTNMTILHRLREKKPCSTSAIARRFNSISFKVLEVIFVLLIL